MNYLVIDSTGLVVNSILWDGKSTWTPPDGHQAIKLPKGSQAGIGWTYTDGQFNPPPEPQD